MPDLNILQPFTTLSEPFTPTLLTTLLILTTLYILTLSPHPLTPTFSLDYTLHILFFLFPPLPYIYSLLLSYTLCLFTLNSTPTATPFILCFWYTFLYSASALNTRLGNGSTRPLVWSNQIAVITGGAGGLGWLIAKILELKGVEVVVWDVKAPEEWSEDQEDEGGVKWMQVDVGDADAVEKAYGEVVRDVRRPSFSSDISHFPFSISHFPCFIFHFSPKNTSRNIC
jgi:hypothetical protein